jgi:hypothetical protein
LIGEDLELVDEVKPAILSNTMDLGRNTCYACKSEVFFVGIVGMMTYVVQFAKEFSMDIVL